MTALLVVDTETGGLNPETDALLSVGLVDWCDGAVRRQTEILVDAEGLRCDPKALAVNGIDLDVHHAYSVPRAYAAKQIQDFCRPMGRPILAGHNVQFDIGFIRRLFTPETLRMTFSHRVMDTLQVLLFLGHAGLVPLEIAKLDQAMAHFGLTMPPSTRHTALGDALVTAELYTRLLATISGVAA
jgi:DNA polymerase III epsilon subunit-like protein